MEITKTKIEDVYVIKRIPFQDERGYFARTFCKRELEEAGMNANFVQSNVSGNNQKGTLRGIHAQKNGFEEDKLIGCTRGKIFDVCVDLRKESATYGQYVGAELSEENGIMLYIPKGCAHGYLTLVDNSQAFYFVTQFYEPGSEVGYRYDDPLFSIDWPIKQDLIISEKDMSWEYVK